MCISRVSKGVRPVVTSLGKEVGVVDQRVLPQSLCGFCRGYRQTGWSCKADLVAIACGDRVLGASLVMVKEHLGQGSRNSQSVSHVLETTSQIRRGRGSESACDLLIR